MDASKYTYLFIVLICCSTTFVFYELSFISGWKNLSKKFLADASISGRVLRNQSAYMGWYYFPVCYTRCLSVGVSRDGLFLKFTFFSPFFHKPIFIPWNEIKSFERSKYLFEDAVILDVAASRGKIIFVGAVVEVLLEVYEKRMRPDH